MPDTIGQRPHPVEHGRETAVLGDQGADAGFGQCLVAAAVAQARSAFKITATSITSCARAPASGGRYPAAAASMPRLESAIPASTLSQRDTAGTAADPDRDGEQVEAIHEQDHVGGLAGGTRTPGTHGYPHICRRQGGRVVEAVADHHRDAIGPLGPDRIHLVLRRAVGQHAVDAQGGGHSLGHVLPVARQHDHLGDACPMQRAQRARRLAPDLVGQQQAPASRPSTARNTLELPSRRARRISPSAQGGTASGQTQASPPSRTRWPPTLPSMPAPAASSTCFGHDRGQAAGSMRRR